MAFADAIAAASAASPMASGSVPIIAGRVLLVDGDGLAYYCAGKDDSDPGEARAQLVAKVKSAQRLVGAERVVVLLTASGSNKGHRYAIARVKPYQGQRADARRPTNWRHLRDFMEFGSMDKGSPFYVESTSSAEADDLFGSWAYSQPENAVIYTQDKDMRMLPGMHLDWVSHRVHKVTCRLVTDDPDYLPSCYVVSEDSVFNEKQYGQRWFWLQMLQGDTADNIPGLPKYKTKNAKGDDALKPMGEVTAERMLGDGGYASAVRELYEGFYGERWLVEMLEQACLLWMRRVPTAWDDCLNPGGPLYIFNDGSEEFSKAYLEIQQRVRDADAINSAAQDNRDSGSTGTTE